MEIQDTAGTGIDDTAATAVMDTAPAGAGVSYWAFTRRSGQIIGGGI